MATVTDLTDHIDSLKREVTPLGTDPIDGVDSTLKGYLIDAFWEAHLDGFMKGYTVDEFGQVSSNSGSGLPREKVALCVLYAGIRILRLQLVNTEAHFRATAGPVGFETRLSASVMSEMLRQLQHRKVQLMEALERTDVYVVDALTTRTLSVGSYGGWVN